MKVMRIEKDAAELLGCTENLQTKCSIAVKNKKLLAAIDEITTTKTGRKTARGSAPPFPQ